MAAFEPKLTVQQRTEIFRRALKGERTCDLAKEFQVHESTITKIKYDKKRLNMAEKKLTARQQHCRLRIMMGAEKGVEKEHEILDREVPANTKEAISLMYLQHQAAVDMMNRGGLKAEDKDAGGVTVVFSGGGGFDPGMPTEMAGDDEAK